MNVKSSKSRKRETKPFAYSNLISLCTREFLFFFFLQAEIHQKYISEFILNSFLYFQLRTAMVKGETGTLSLNIRASVDKGVILMSQSVDRRVCLLHVLISCSITDKMIPSATEKTAVPHQRIFLHQHR